VSGALARLARSEDVQAVAVMPDVHLADDVCVSTVVATHRLLYPNAVGGDIGCGMAALAFDGPASVCDRRKAARILAGFADLVPILKQRSRVEPSGGLWAQPLSDPALEKIRDRNGLLQAGTLGRGNHFLELQMDEGGRLWLMAHSGSRGIGQRIRDHHLRRCERSSVGLGYLDAKSSDGTAYLNDMAWALAYAVTGIRANLATRIDCHHNHVEVMVGNGETLWIHRKGAISARDGEQGIIPGSMGAPSFHVCGRGVAEALWSSSHGAGRSMSRGEARRRFSVRDLDRQAKGIWFDRRNARRLVDEAPAAYKDIGKVMRAQAGLTRIVRRLTPVLSYKGG
jgi:tRNA-splicing ligase RtcB